jgi:hypothetical protein
MFSDPVLQASDSGGTAQPAEEESPPANTSSAGDRGAGVSGASDLLMELSTLGILAILVGFIVLLRRWLTLRSRKPHPGLPQERVLPLSAHTTLHDPKYLGRIVDVDDAPP